MEFQTMQNKSPLGGTGSRLGEWIIILAGVSALAASLVTFVSVWLQTKNYRKPLLQRYVVRILLMVPIYSIASWVSLISLRAAFWIDPFRDVYEAFTIYAFFQLLINFVGGERSLIIMMHGRPPVSHPWPLSLCLSKIDISDPHTFLAMKRGILQYTWVKPALSLATIIMKATGTYKEGYTSADSGYFWSGIIYNISITISLYALAMFWVCMASDLKPFRPMPKFLCIKGIIFASYWQGFMLSILVFLAAIPENLVEGYTPDNLAAAIQDALICFEMPMFAVLHWYAFSWHDYADVTISAARMPVKFALRDAFGPRDLIEDAKETFAGGKYEYRYFDAEDDVLAHEDSAQRAARMSQGMRYERGGKGKYWIRQPGKPDSKTPLLQPPSEENSRSSSPAGRNDGPACSDYGTAHDALGGDPVLCDDEERLYTKARALTYGDWNYPVITAHNATREDRMYRDPDIITASTNRNLLQPTEDYRRRRKSQIERIQASVDKGKHRPSSASSSKSKKKSGSVLPSLLSRQKSSSGESTKSDRSQLVDLVVEDEAAEEVDKVRARKSGNPAWNTTQSRHFVNVHPDARPTEDVLQGTEGAGEDLANVKISHGLSLGENEESAESDKWKQRDYTEDGGTSGEVKKGDEDVEDERNVWDSPKR